MPFLPSLLEIIVGILLLFGGGEFFVAGSVAIALRLGIPQIVIGLTLVSLGTSAPELFVSMISTVQENDGIAVANVVGSNIFNVLVVLGLSALVMPLRVKSRLVRRDVPLLLAVSMAVWGMAAGGRVYWQAGLALLMALVINIVWECRTASETPDEADDFDEADRSSIPVAVLKLAAGLVLLVIGSQVLVRGAEAAAALLQIPESVVGITIVAAGTSMPELVTSVVAANRGKADIAVGNVVGSNIINLMLILGLCATFSGEGLLAEPNLVNRDMPIMVVSILACLPIFWSGGVIKRREGLLLVALYVLYLGDQLLEVTGAGGLLFNFRAAVLVLGLPLVMVFLAWESLLWFRARKAQSPN
ncbi:MAG: calcium/sodium antiporter [Cyanobacteria bacterium K_DeepCast_35m_m2_155]|nr:calcium/sodium antiporter [Cyanobacteria bacterium K_DeepCast_35m_m2_155]